MVKEMDVEEAKAQQQNKYDRQLRLWGARGQAALAGARVLLVGAGPTATETAKNLVLPGVGAVTVLDGHAVGPRDLANNFFVTPADVGKPRAEAAAAALAELNPDCACDWRRAFPEEVLATEPGYVAAFTLVVGCQLRGALQQQLAQACRARGVPLLLVRSYGLIGHVRIVTDNHEVVEARPDPAPVDLRLADPFPTLREYALGGLDLAALDNAAHGHVPYVLLLLRLQKAWKDQHEGRLPATFEEKQAFKASVRAAARDFAMELNFQEAHAEAYRAYVAQELPYEVAELFELEEVLNPQPTSSNFIFLVRALKDFMAAEGEGKPPLSGQIPDMTGSSEMYMAVQEIYQARARADQAAVGARLRALLAAAGRPEDTVSEEELATFCKNTLSLQRYASGALEEEFQPAPDQLKETVAMAMMDLPEDAAQCPLLWYIGLRGVDQFFEKNGHYPGTQEDLLLPDGMSLWNEMQTLVKGWETEVPPLSKKHATEMTRYGGAELHNIAAVIGGIASQEAVKIITHQFTPLKNTLIYNGIAGISGVYEL